MMIYIQVFLQKSQSMVAKKNILGMKFGSLTAIQEAGRNKNGRALWLCRCDCGEERIASGKDLGKKVTRCPKKCVLTEDLTGKMFGNLLVLQQEGSDKHGFRRFRCRCMTPLKAIENDRDENTFSDREGICGAELLINAIAIKQDLKNGRERKVPKSCMRCSRILWGKDLRKRNPMEDLSGQTFGRLTAIRPLFRGHKKTYKRPMYECACSCGSGAITYVRREALIGNSVQPIRSCGCLQVEAARENKANLIHGLSNHPLYGVRSNIIKRCYDNKCKAFPRYGGRGIRLCDAWLEDITTFYQWAIDHGWTENSSIDRIDNNGPYSPENCQILSRKENALKRFRDHGTAFEVDGKQVNVHELSKKTKVSGDLCKKLLSNGYSEADVYSYGKLPLHQKNALSRSIHQGQKITIAEAREKNRIAKIKPPQSSEMGSYRAMMARCYNPKDHSYRNYGARGIKVCSQWKNNPLQFFIDMGPKPEPKVRYALDRVDPDKDYSPDNCRWITREENSSRVTRY